MRVNHHQKNENENGNRYLSIIVVCLVDLKFYFCLNYCLYLIYLYRLKTRDKKLTKTPTCAREKFNTTNRQTENNPSTKRLSINTNDN